MEITSLINYVVNSLSINEQNEFLNVITKTLIEKRKKDLEYHKEMARTIEDSLSDIPEIVNQTNFDPIILFCNIDDSDY